MKKWIVLLVMVLVGVGWWGYQHYVKEKPSDSICEVVLVGGHRNAPAPDLNNAKFVEELKSVYKSNGEVIFISVDGKPSVTQTNKVFGMENTSGLTTKKLDRMAEKQVEKLLDQAADIRASSPEVDYVAALHVAEGVLDSSHCPKKRITILGSLLNTTGIFSYANNGDLIQGEPEKVVEILSQQKAIPDLTDVESVDVYGAATVAEPQKQLSYNQSDCIEEQYKSLLEEAGVKKVRFHKTSMSTDNKMDGYKSLPYVTPISFLDETVDFSGVRKFDEDTIKFIGDKASFVDEAKAEESLTPIAEWLNEDTRRQIIVCGTTATGKKNFCKNLSQARAEAVKDVLVSKGVNTEQVSCLGLGCDNKWHINDLGDNGKLIEEKAKQNRAVYILDRNSNEAEGLLN